MMKDLNDYSGEFNPNVKYQDFSKDFLAKLLVEYGRCYILADTFWYGEVKKRWGGEVAHEINLGMWVDKYPPAEMKRILPILNLKGNDVEDAIKYWQLTPMFVAGMFKFDIELKNRHQALITVTDCPALRYFEKMEPERIVPICHELELYSARAYAKIINPDIVVTMPTVPPRKSPNDICCQFEFKQKN